MDDQASRAARNERGRRIDNDPQGSASSQGSDPIARAIAAIDALNARDPNSLRSPGGAGEARPKELVHAELVTRWVLQLDPDPSDALRLAARAHHVERWVIPRAEYPEGREGYLRWRATLQRHHSETAARVLEESNVPAATIERVKDIIRKRRLRSDPEVQCFEDALCLVFLETQLDALSERLEHEKMVDVLRRTLPKMSETGRDAAISLPLRESERALLDQALRDLEA